MGHCSKAFDVDAAQQLRPRCDPTLLDVASIRSMRRATEVASMVKWFVRAPWSCQCTRQWVGTSVGREMATIVVNWPRCCEPSRRRFSHFPPSTQGVLVHLDGQFGSASGIVQLIYCIARLLAACGASRGMNRFLRESSRPLTQQRHFHLSQFRRYGSQFHA
jgi:hypothetical protein